MTMEEKGEAFQNAWHNVRGATTQELLRAEEEVNRKYGDILTAPRPVSGRHLPMSMENRAAQFSPFAALSGYENVLENKADQVLYDVEHLGEHRESPEEEA